MQSSSGMPLTSRTFSSGAGAKAKGETAAADAKMEPEKDAVEDNRPRVDPKLPKLDEISSTLNLMPVRDGKLVMTLIEDGFQYLLAAARCNVGLRSGRYFFEASITEKLDVPESHAQRSRSHLTKPTLRIGLTTMGGPDSVARWPLLTEKSATGLYFDTDGHFSAGQSLPVQVGHKISRQQMMGLLVNLDAESETANTVSLFVDGARVSDPMPIPTELIGKPLFPAITFRSATVFVNFGPAPKAPLPFACRMISEAAEEDLLLPTETDKKPGQIVLPIGLPGTGYFDFIDHFMATHPDFVELSDRKIFDWVEQSGLPRGRNRSTIASVDKPDPKFGVSPIDEFGVRKVLTMIAPTVARNYVIAELTANLLPESRAKFLRSFSAPKFERTSLVMLGAPSSDFLTPLEAKVLERKRRKGSFKSAQKSAATRTSSSAAEVPTDADAATATATAKTEARGEEAAAQGGEKVEGAEAGEAAVKEEGAEGQEQQQQQQQQQKQEQEQQEKQEQQEAVNEKCADETGTNAATEEVALQDEDWKDYFQNREYPDISDRVLGKHYTAFSLPSVDDGFDDVSYVWEDESSARAFFKSWILERKLTQRVDDLAPGAWFQEKWKAWKDTIEDYKALQWKRKAEPPKDEAAKESTSSIVAEEVDVFAVEDVKDIGNQEPLFAKFEDEDWVLLTIRCEIHLLLHAVRKDLNDPDRPSFSEKHLQFYYDKYYRRVFDIKYFNASKFEEFQDLIKDVVAMDPKTTLLKALCDEETNIDRFVKVTEQDRRDRQQRADAGDETAKLRFIRPPEPHSRPAHSSRGGRGFGRRGRSQDKPGSRGPPPPSYRGDKPRSGPPAHAAHSDYRGSRGGGPPANRGPPAKPGNDRARPPIGGNRGPVGGRSAYSSHANSGDKRPYRGGGSYYGGGGGGGGAPKSQRIGMSSGAYGGRR